MKLVWPSDKIAFTPGKCSWVSDRVNLHLKGRSLPDLKIETWGTHSWYKNKRSETW